MEDAKCISSAPKEQIATNQTSVSLAKSKTIAACPVKRSDWQGQIKLDGLAVREIS
jgi:hypothetical protein